MNQINSVIQSNGLVKTDSNKALGIILTIYFTLKPLYLLPSGLPQISDTLLIISALFIFFFKEHLKIIIPYKYAKWIYVYIAALCYQTIVEFLWWTATDDVNMLLKLSYYIFNFIASFLCVYVGNRIGKDSLKLAICKGCFYSAIVTFVGFLLNFSSGIRSAGFFNNPNQLGYHALLLATVIAFFPDQLSKWQNVFVIVVAVLGTVVSMSKAALVGLAALAICYAIWGGKKKTIKTIVFQTLFLFITLCNIYLFLYSEAEIIAGNQTVYAVRGRVFRMFDENDSSLGEGRGYLRVTELGTHFLWGMGEGDFYRFRYLSGLEVHSTFVNLLVSYGIIGFCFYLWLMAKSMLIHGMNIRNIACFFGLFLYFFTHNGIRNTLLWILIAAVMQVTVLSESESDQKL